MSYRLINLLCNPSMPMQRTYSTMDCVQKMRDSGVCLFYLTQCWCHIFHRCGISALQQPRTWSWKGLETTCLETGRRPLWIQNKEITNQKIKHSVPGEIFPFDPTLIVFVHSSPSPVAVFKLYLNVLKTLSMCVLKTLAKRGPVF